MYSSSYFFKTRFLVNIFGCLIQLLRHTLQFGLSEPNCTLSRGGSRWFWGYINRLQSLPNINLEFLLEAVVIVNTLLNKSFVNIEFFSYTWKTFHVNWSDSHAHRRLRLAIFEVLRLFEEMYIVKLLTYYLFDSAISANGL